ncbi:MAG: SH3 beta-barrel fold-containing protein [Bacteroidia bacterium]
MKEIEMTSENQVFKTEEEKEWLKGILREREVTVIFVKKDGTERKMLCTLSENKIPEEKMPVGTGKTKNSDALAVFDLEKEEWRSFRYDSIKSFATDL